MSDQFSIRYTILFAVAVAAVCSLFVASSVVLLRPYQEVNFQFDRMRNVLQAAGLVKAGSGRAEVMQNFRDKVRPIVIRLETGEPGAGIDPLTYNQTTVLNDPAMSRPAPANPAGVLRLPTFGSVYQILANGKVVMLVLPIHGMGLWGQIYGFLAIDRDTRHVRGVSFYDHKETPGLGDELESPHWTARWIGRLLTDSEGAVRFAIVKGNVGSPEHDPYRVDAISGATMTSRGVSEFTRFWVGPEGYGPYLRRFRAEQGEE